MKEQIRQIVKEEVTKHLGVQQEQDAEQVNESLLVIAGLVIGLGAAWGWMRSFIQRLTKDVALAKFIEDYDQPKIIERKIPETLRKFKLISSLNDLETMEKTVKDIVADLQRMESKIDQFVDAGNGERAEWVTKSLMLNPQKEKTRLKKEFRRFITDIQNSFELSVENKRDALFA